MLNTELDTTVVSIPVMSFPQKCLYAKNISDMYRYTYVTLRLSPTDKAVREGQVTQAMLHSQITQLKTDRDKVHVHVHAKSQLLENDTEQKSNPKAAIQS